MALTEKENAKIKLYDLTQRLAAVIQAGKEAVFSETDVSSKFILPFLSALGWDITDIDQVKEQKRTLSGPVDYSLALKRKPRLLLELKRFDEQLDGYREIHGRRETFPEQACRYAWHLKVEWVVLTNFKEVRLYNSLYRKPIDGLRLKISFSQFVAEIDKLWTISRQSVEAGELDKIEKKAERKDIDQAVLEDLLKIRSLISEGISSSNPQLSIPIVRECVQKIMDRLIVIRVAEDRDSIGFESLRRELESWKGRGLPTPFLRSLKSIFIDFHDIYDTKLFEQHLSEDLLIDNNALETTIDILYQYNFGLLSADVLGAIYEDYLGHVLQETISGGVQIIESSDARKKEGIYYTPTHLVEYVVRTTLGEILIKCKSPDEVSKIKVLDLSCGSGSFLIKAFDLIKQWYDEYNFSLTPKEQNLTAHFQKVTDIERKILEENLFGVDIDTEAAEIAAVNLMLKAMKPREKLPEILGQNIKVGNSLVDGTETAFSELSQEAKAGLRPFNWKQEFADVMAVDGFDVIIGNPPYFKVRKTNPIRVSTSFETVKTGPVNAAMMFIDEAVKLAKPNGRIGLVLPKMLTYTKGWKGSRKIVLNNRISSIIDCQEAFEGVLLEQILLIFSKIQPDSSHIYRIGDAKGLDITISSRQISQESSKNEDFLFIEPANIAYSIREKMLSGSVLIERDKVCDIILGLGIQSLNCWHENYVPGDQQILRGDDVQNWHIRGSLYFSPLTTELTPYTNNITQLRKPHIVAQRIIAHIRNPKPHIILMSAYDKDGSFAFNTVTHFLCKNPNFDCQYILGLLNSKLFSFYAYKFIYNNAIRSMDFYEDYAGRLPVKILLPDAQQPIIDIVKLITAHFKLPQQMKPIYRKYLTERVVGNREFQVYYRFLDPNERDPKDSETGGIIKKLVVTENNDWLIFNVDYVDTEKQKTITDHEVLRCRFKESSIRTFLLQEINSKGPPNRGRRLLDKILSITVPTFDSIMKRDKEMIEMQLQPYLSDVQSHYEWEKEFRDLDTKLNKAVYEIYGLNDDEVTHIEENSKPSGWHKE